MTVALSFPVSHSLSSMDCSRSCKHGMVQSICCLSLRAHCAAAARSSRPRDVAYVPYHRKRAIRSHGNDDGFAGGEWPPRENFKSQAASRSTQPYIARRNFNGLQRRNRAPGKRDDSGTRSILHQSASNPENLTVHAAERQQRQGLRKLRRRAKSAGAANRSR